MDTCIFVKIYLSVYLKWMPFIVCNYASIRMILKVKLTIAMISATEGRTFGIIRKNNGEGRLLLVGWPRKQY